jgi:hypothetical protein
MLERTTAALGPRLTLGVSAEQLEGALIPDGLRGALSRYPGAAATIDRKSHYQILEVICGERQIVDDARTGSGTLRLVAVAENTQIVTTDPMIFVPLGEGDRVTDPAECYGCELDAGRWRARDLEYTFAEILPWRWARPFTDLGYELGREIINLAWSGPVEDLGNLLDQCLELRAAPLFQVGTMTGQLEEAGAWIASRRRSGTYRLCLGGPVRTVRRVEEALHDARLSRLGIKPR